MTPSPSASPLRPVRPSNPGRLPLALVAAGLVLCALPAAASAQERPLDGPDWVISVNPAFLVLMGIFQLDVEQELSPGITVGPSLFYHHAADRRYAPKLAADVVFRYYPEGRPFSGFAVGALTGFTAMEYDESARNALGLGFTAEHHWLLGEDERLALAVGVGGKRLFYLSERGRAWRAVPLMRASLGWTF